MTPREKILIDALNTVKRHHNDPAMQRLYGTSTIIQGGIDEALKQADEIKDGPGQKDKERIHDIDTSINNFQQDVSIADRKWMVSELKKYMAI